MQLTGLFRTNFSNTPGRKHIPHPMHVEQMEHILASMLFWMLRLYFIIKQSRRKAQNNHFLRPRCCLL